MSLFQIKWLRRLLRRNMVPIGQPKAANWKQRLSLGYMLLAWNAFGMVCYLAYTGRRDWAEYYGFKTEADKAITPGLQWAKTLKMDQAKVVRFSGLTKTEEINYKKEDEDEQELIEITDSM